MQTLDILLTLAVKLGSSILGAILALVFQPPKARAEFITRAGFSVLSGVIFSGQVRTYLAWPVTIETDLAAGALTALLSWWLMGAVVRIIGAWTPKA